MGEEGAVAVEFAMVVLPLVMLFFGIVGYGFLFTQQVSMTHAAREAARYGSVAAYVSGTWKPHSCQEVIDRARSTAASVTIPNTSGITVTVTRDGGSPCSGSSTPCTGGTTDSSLKVKLNYDSGLVLPLVSWNGKVEAEGVFKCEYN